MFLNADERKYPIIEVLCFVYLSSFCLFVMQSVTLGTRLIISGFCEGSMYYSTGCWQVTLSPVRLCKHQCLKF